MANTQTVTVVFTDLVGSTALLSRVGEERAEELRREHFGILRDAITGAGCREVKNLGDKLMIVADNAAQGAADAVDPAGFRPPKPSSRRAAHGAGRCIARRCRRRRR